MWPSARESPAPSLPPTPRGEPQAGQASPDAPITLTVLLNHTVPYPAPATLSLSLSLEKLSSGKPAPDAKKVGDCGFRGDFILSEPLDPLLYSGDDKSWVGLKNK